MGNVGKPAETHTSYGHELVLDMQTKDGRGWKCATFLDTILLGAGGGENGGVHAIKYSWEQEDLQKGGRGLCVC